MVTPSSRRQIALWEIMVLVAGAAAGLGLARVGLRDVGVSDSELDYHEWWLWVFLIYASLLGMTMTVTPLLLLDRIRTGYRWKAGVMAWFAMGCLAWLQATLLAVDHLVIGKPVLLEVSVELFTGGIFLGGVILFFTYLASGRAVRGWWCGRGWWPEWTGMWLLGFASIGGLAVLVLILFIGYL